MPEDIPIEGISRNQMLVTTGQTTSRGILSLLFATSVLVLYRPTVFMNTEVL